MLELGKAGLHAGLRRASLCMGAAVVVGALCGALVPDAPLSPRAALAFLLLGVALVLGLLRSAVPARASGLLLVLVAFACLTDRSPGSLPPDATVALAALGVAIALPRRALRVAHGLALGALLLSWLALFTYAYTIKFPMGLALYVRMPLVMVGLVNVAVAGLLCARPDEGLMALVTVQSSSGVMVRRLLPAAIGLPLLLGWLILAVEQRHVFNARFGISLFVVLTIVLFGSLVLLTSRAIEQAERQRAGLAAILLEEAERRHLARELHDEIGQTLTGLKLRLESMRGTEELSGRIEEASALVHEVMRRVSRLSLDLRPAMLDDLGVLPALLWLIERYEERTEIEVAFEHRGIEGRFARELETTAFRIAQEALTNVARHAGVSRVRLRVWAHESLLCVQVEDQGCGFAFEEALASGRSSGLRGMRERALGVGGRLRVESAAGQGTALLAELPLSAAPDP